MTRSIKPVIARPNKFIRIKNPNPGDEADCFIQKDGIRNKPLKLFSSPIKGWSLSKEDEALIDKLVEEKLK